jgi:hypothetical protein
MVANPASLPRFVRRNRRTIPLDNIITYSMITKINSDITPIIDHSATVANPQQRRTPFYRWHFT